MNPLENPPEGYREAIDSITQAAAEHRASPEVEMRLLAAFREQTPPVTRKVSSPVWVPYAIGAVAAGLLAWFAVTPRTAASLPPGVHATSNVMPEEPLIVALGNRAQLPAGKVTARVRLPKRGRPPLPPPLPADATPFLPIPYAEALSPSENAEVVRVQLPRSALLAFGVPVDELRMAERIQADVVLGEDGVVRAVRFVR